MMTTPHTLMLRARTGVVPAAAGMTWQKAGRLQGLEQIKRYVL